MKSEYFILPLEIYHPMVLENHWPMVFHVDDYSCVRHPQGHRPEREPLSWVCGFYLRRNWNVMLASSLQRFEMNSR